MKRFILTYQREGHSMDIEGVQFSSGMVVLELYPDNEWTDVRSFHSLENMEYHLNEFGDTSIEWLNDEEEWTPDELDVLQARYQSLVIGKNQPWVVITTIEAKAQLKKLGLLKEENHLVEVK